MIVLCVPVQGSSPTLRSVSSAHTAAQVGVSFLEARAELTTYVR